MPSHTLRLSTRTSLYAGYASLVAFMLLIAAISLYALANSNKDFSSTLTALMHVPAWPTH